MSVQSEPEARPGRGLRLLALCGAAGGVVTLVVGGVALATGVVYGHTTRVVEQAPPPLKPGRGRGLDAEAIYAREAPGVAFVQSYGVTGDTPFGQSEGVAEGSGFAVDRDGDILTNAHVVDGAKRVTVRFGGRGSTLPARVLGKDDSNDLAVLHVDRGKAKVSPLPLGDSGTVRVGDPVVAIGNPFGLDRTITAGIVSALQRKITAPDGFTIDHVVQTDAAINPGNSGGPLIDAHGRVIGINSQIATGGSGDANVGIGFAVPINTAKAELPTLERGDSVAHPFLGVDTVTLDRAMAKAMGLLGGQRGALVERVTGGGPAAKSGLRGGDITTEAGVLLGGDVIVSLDGRSIGSSGALAQAVAGHRAGETVPLAYIRNGKRRIVRVRLDTRPDG
jgi:S1-C subfamily serine protease